MASPALNSYHVDGGIFEASARAMSEEATSEHISSLDLRRAAILSSSIGYDVEDKDSASRVPKTISVGTSPLGPTVSFMPFRLSRKLSSRCRIWYRSRSTQRMRPRGALYLSPVPRELRSSTANHWRCMPFEHVDRRNRSEVMSLSWSTHLTCGYPR